MLEFPAWDRAKPWSYISGYAVADSLRELGHEVELTLLFNGAPGAELVRPLKAYAEAGVRFDVAFFWLPHLQYSRQFWDVARSLSDKRIGVVIESLRYTAAELVQFRFLRGRRGSVLKELKHCTHVVTFDHGDFTYLSRRGFKAFWSPGLLPSVPVSLCHTYAEKRPMLLAAGTVYGKRRRVYEQLTAEGVLNKEERLEHSRELTDRFNTLCEAVRRACCGQPELQALRSLGNEILLVRRALWYEYLRYVSGFAGVVSLPAFFKGFPGRVFEGILARSVVFVFENSDLSRQKAIFPHGTHLFYLGERLDLRDVRRIREVISDHAQADRIASAAYQRANDECQANHVTELVLRWATTTHARKETGWLRKILTSAASPSAQHQRFYSELGYEAN